MKIVFLAPSIDYGRDGIADYTERLGNYCSKQGHIIKILPTGRNNWVKSMKCVNKRFDEIKNEIKIFNPDVISWQFDGRTFHPLSIYPWFLAPSFKGMNCCLHLMAHETWEGDEQGTRLQRRVKGVLQRVSVTRTLKKIEPSLLHATNPLYKSHLETCGFSASVLPLFSSVPVCSDLPRTDYDGEEWHFVLFGGFRSGWDPELMMERLLKSGRRLVFHQLGGGANSSAWKSFRDAYPGKAEFIEHGRQSPEVVSKILMSVHFGISTYELVNLAKSSVYATYRDHGLPVLLTRQDAERSRSGGDKDFREEGLLRLEDIPKNLAGCRRGAAVDMLTKTGERLLDELQAALNSTMC